MLAIRMQRTGRKGHAMFRVVVQDSRRTPSSGKLVALLGSYDPHAKVVTLKKDRAQFYLEHGAQPSDRVVRLFEQEGVKLPSWVQKSAAKKGSIRNPEKLRKNRPAEEVAAEAPAEEASTEVTEKAAEAPATETENVSEPEA
ncbi:MAG: 30S ribosomal protein S16 [Candidatus Saccharimonadales bacterium]|jgi:small subunit ribosomal protein S16